MINQKHRDTIETMMAWILLNLNKADQATTQEIEQLLENTYKEEHNLDRALMHLLFALQTALKKDLLNNLEIPNDFRQLLLNRTRVKLAKLPERTHRQLENKLKTLMSSDDDSKKISQSGGGILDWLSANLYLALSISSGIFALLLAIIIFIWTHSRSPKRGTIPIVASSSGTQFLPMPSPQLNYDSMPPDPRASPVYGLLPPDASAYQQAPTTVMARQYPNLPFVGQYQSPPTEAEIETQNLEQWLAIYCGECLKKGVGSRSCRKCAELRDFKKRSS